MKYKQVPSLADLLMEIEMTKFFLVPEVIYMWVQKEL